MFLLSLTTPHKDTHAVPQAKKIGSHCYAAIPGIATTVKNKKTYEVNYHEQNNYYSCNNRCFSN
ncbi:hypothetical protein KL86SPO_50510 [uncultured Sporomusa sp.]|uniref:Uncharacterized protein n=1 Tax=uncultured Sporomusa sp. TaxID=307249 RepID=A0A212LZB1_9FIRM|nr:hypothetical protein KL86SPO_50510 [uncultured Sporomusa sp.]